MTYGICDECTASLCVDQSKCLITGAKLVSKSAWEQSKMTKADDVPEWAWNRARELLLEGDPRTPINERGTLAAWIVGTFARYIAAHEQDPLIEQAREIAYETRRKRPGCAGYADGVCQKIKAGQWDDHMLVQAALAGLRARSVTLGTGGEGA